MALVSRAAALLVASAVAAGCAVWPSTPSVGYAELYYADPYRDYGYGDAYQYYSPLYYGGAYNYYPHSVFDGRDVYYVGGRWIFREGASWNYYPTEPPALYRYRTTIRQAPPAPRFDYGTTPGVVIQPAQPLPPPSVAPPGERVR